MTVEQIIGHLRVSQKVVYRYRSECGISRLRTMLSDEQKEDLYRVYFTEGRKAAEKKYPNSHVESLITRQTKYRRRALWTSQDRIEMVRMAGFISFRDQQTFLNRPSKIAASLMVWGYWRQFHKVGSQRIHGLTGILRRSLCYRDAPVFRLPPQIPERRSQRQKEDGTLRQGMKMVIWSDAENYLLPGVSDFFRDIVRDGARFQRWLYQTDDPSSAIKTMISERTGLYEKRGGHVLYRVVA